MLRDYFAPCTLGLEEVLARELVALGASDVAAVRGGARFRGDRRIGYAANLWLRSAVRVQEQVAEFQARDKDELSAACREVPWEQWLDVDGTLAVDASVRDSEITHSGFAALTVKDAVCDRFRVRTGRRPNVDAGNPSLPIKLVLQQDSRHALPQPLGREPAQARLAADPGEEPAQRGDRGRAAAALELGPQSPLVDPMCGSGTFVVEAASLAADRAPGMQRRFAFESFPDFDVKTWASLKAEAQERAQLALPFVIEGADRHEGALSLAHRSVRAAGVEGLVKLSHADLRSFAPSASLPTVITNPPWGERLGEGDDLVDTWRALGDFLRARCAGGTAFVLSGDPDLPEEIGYKPRLLWPVMVSNIECRLLRYDLFPRFALGKPAA
jgi:putative N6-adenine-specific DNA methylase